MVADNHTEKSGGLERLKQDRACVAILDAEEAVFRKEMESWVLNRHAQQSQPLTDEIREAVIEGYNRMIDGFDYANSDYVNKSYTRMVQQDMMEGRSTPGLPSLARDVGALWLEQRLHEIEEIRQSPDAGRIVRGLLGSAIIRAVNTATKLGVPNAYVRYKLCGGDLEGYLQTVAERAAELATEKSIRATLNGDGQEIPTGKGGGRGM